MKNQNFGIEIELTGITREQAARVIAEYFHSTPRYEGTGYRTWTATDTQGRTWKAMSDASISCQRKVGGAIVNVDNDYSCEVVSPILQYSDIEDLKAIVRALRAASAIANSSTGIHVHVGAETHTAQTLRNLANIVASREDLIAHALAINPNRYSRYCQPADKRFMVELNSKKPATRAALQAIWYNGHDGSSSHYDSSRYHLLNLHATWTKGTVEFRCFNGSTHAGEIKAFIQFCLAINHQALTQRSATYRKVETDNEKYAFRCWLLRLGLIGEEFKTARTHLMKHLEGNSAWRHAS
jgi:hypothetical protein